MAQGGIAVSKVKFGVIGLGWFGEKHCEALASLPNVELHSLCTRTKSRLKEVAQRFGVKKTFTDYNEMLADPELEAVNIVTMWDQHAAPTLAALKAGKHVFCEKPMASTMADCRKMVAAAQKAKVTKPVRALFGLAQQEGRTVVGGAAKGPSRRSPARMHGSSPSSIALARTFRSSRTFPGHG